MAARPGWKELSGSLQRFRWVVAIGDHVDQLAVEAVDRSEKRTTKLDRILGDSIEHGLQFSRSAANDREYVTRRSLLFERLGEFLEQPRVLYGDDGLVGEGFEQLDLHRGKSTLPFSANMDNTNSHTVAQKWSREYGADTHRDAEGFGKFFLRRSQVRDVNRLAIDDRATGRRATIEDPDLTQTNNHGDGSKVRRAAQ